MDTTPDLFETIAYHLDQARVALDQLHTCASQAKPKAPVVASNVKIARHVLLDVICTQLSAETFSTPGISYSIKDFRNHCRPFLSLSNADMKKDKDGKPSWAETL
ncbi:MAG: hypothetical protein ACO3WK_12450, partial [Steroidobacteraceae bacterium]